MRSETDAPQAEGTRPVDRFLAAWLGDPSPATREALARVLDEVAVSIASAWPKASPKLDAFWPELARCVPEDSADEALPSVVSHMHAADSYLAFCCRRGDAAALERFEREHMAPLGPAIGKVDASASFVDEVKQRVRTKLLVAEGDELPKIAHYGGQGPLQGWVRVVAVREALSSVRAQRRQALVSDEALMAIEASATGPELGALKQQYRAQFAESFRDALTHLEPAQRNLLRLHYLHGLTIDELGGLLEVHRSSAARRIAKTRQELLTATRRGLQARLRMGRGEFDQLMGLIASRLDLSIERFLVERDGEASTSASG
ncbi:MAG: sigma-70 family RNA polymerase sigma factor [Myxococcota bacterium]